MRKKIGCGVDEGTRRKIVYPNDLQKYYKVWDKKLKKCFSLIPQLKQPLKELISKELWTHIEEVSDGKKEMDFILKNFYNDDNSNHIIDKQ